MHGVLPTTNGETYEATELHVESRCSLSQEFDHRNTNDVRVKTNEHSHKHASSSAASHHTTVSSHDSQKAIRSAERASSKDVLLFSKIKMSNIDTMKLSFSVMTSCVRLSFTTAKLTTDASKSKLMQGDVNATIVPDSSRFITFARTQRRSD